MRVGTCGAEFSLAPHWPRPRLAPPVLSGQNPRGQQAEGGRQLSVAPPPFYKERACLETRTANQ